MKKDGRGTCYPVASAGTPVFRLMPQGFIVGEALGVRKLALRFL
jgi:hypothetical protein